MRGKRGRGKELVREWDGEVHGEKDLKPKRKKWPGRKMYITKEKNRKRMLGVVNENTGSKVREVEVRQRNGKKEKSQGEESEKKIKS